MKRYLFGSFAITMALTIVAFTNHKRVKLDFYFGGNVTSQASVEDPTNWDDCHILTCDGVDQKACSILNVDSTFYHLDNGIGCNILNNHAYKVAHQGTNEETIHAARATCGTFYVNSVSNGNRVNATGCP